MEKSKEKQNIVKLEIVESVGIKDLKSAYINDMRISKSKPLSEMKTIIDIDCREDYILEALGYSKDSVVLSRGEYEKVKYVLKYEPEEAIIRLEDLTKNERLYSPHMFCSLGGCSGVSKGCNRTCKESWIVMERKETAEKILNYLELSGIDTALFNTKIKPYIESMYGINTSCKPIVGFDNYVVSNKGIVINTETNEIKAQTLDRKGYACISIFKDSKMTTIRVHRLVAMAFIDNPENKPEINHINGIKTDNRVENLEWCTTKENCVHKVEVLGKGNIRPVRCVETGIIYRSGLYASKLCNTSSGAISNSCNDKSRQKTAGGYHWEHIDEVK